jgi:ribosomal protein S18 acetylase RimI-like enzyme
MFRVRKATAGDAATLGRLRHALFRESGRQPEAGAPPFEADATAALAETIARGTCEAWLAESDAREAIGSVALLLLPRLPSPESRAQQEGYLLNVYTLPEWRRRGVAASLVAAAVARARELGLARIRLHATEDGQRVYAAAGFQSRQDEMELRL